MMVFSDVSKSWQPLLWRACGPGKILGVCTLSFISFKTRLRSDGYSHTPKILPGLSGTLLGEVAPRHTRKIGPSHHVGMRPKCGDRFSDVSKSVAGIASDYLRSAIKITSSASMVSTSLSTFCGQYRGIPSTPCVKSCPS